MLWCLREAPANLGFPSAMIPVFLPLRELKDVTQNLDDFIQEQLSLSNLGTPQGFGKRLLAHGNLLLLFDAWTRWRTRPTAAKWRAGLKPR